MTAMRLSSVRIEYDPDSLSLAPGGARDQKDLSIRIAGVISRLKLVTLFLSYRFDAAGTQMQDPAVSTVWIILSRNPDPETDVTRGNLTIERHVDPVALLDIPTDAAALGEFAIDCIDWACARLEPDTDLPADFIRKQMEAFRTQGYAQHSALAPQKIAGSVATGRIHGRVSCSDTVLTLEVSHEGQPLFERVIWKTKEQAFNIAFSPREIVVEDGCLKVRAASMGLLPEAVFPLDTLPAAFSKTLTTHRA